MEHKVDEQKPVITEKPKRSILPKILIGVVGALVVFQLGLMVGKGQLSFGSHFFKSVGDNQNLPANLDYSSVEEVYDKIRRGYDGKLEKEKLLEGLKQGLAQASGDPYTEFFNTKAAKDFDEQLGGTFSGIGAELGKDEASNVIVIAPISGFPAEKAGLKAKDLIAEVNGESMVGKTVNEVVTKVRGETGTKVKLTVIRNKTQELKFEITRAQIKVPSVKTEILEGNIGYMKIGRFGDDTTELAQQAAQEFKDKKVSGIILDMRDNPGGLLNSAVDVSSLWLSRNQTILQEKRGGKVIEDFKGTSNNPILKGIPTVVLINEGSASASEITAGALRDNKVASLIGVKTFGKGSVQQLERLDDGSMVKITIAHWFTPGGRNINKQGIEPDKKIEISEEDTKNSRDPQKDAAIQQLKK